MLGLVYGQIVTGIRGDNRSYKGEIIDHLKKNSLQLDNKWVSDCCLMLNEQSFQLQFTFQ